MDVRVHFGSDAELSSQAVLLSKRSICHLKLSSFGAALMDTNSALSVENALGESIREKLRFRRASALIHLGSVAKATSKYVFFVFVL
jgi:hypothetical protein